MKPGWVTTRLAYFRTGKGASTVDEVVSGSLADIGRTPGPQVYGSTMHVITGVLAAPLFFNRVSLHSVQASQGVTETDIVMKNIK